MFRAPEQLDLFPGNPINEKVDIWALGVILYNLLFDSQPFLSNNKRGKLNSSNKLDQCLALTEDMEQSYSPLLIQLLKSLLKYDPAERLTAAEIAAYIEENKDKEGVKNTNENKMIVNITKRTESLSKRFSDATAKIFKRHSTQFYVLKLMNNDSLNAFPKYKYIKLLVNKAWVKRQKVGKLYANIATRPIHYFSFLALKAVYIVHTYIFLGPPETLSPDSFNMDEFLAFFSNLWSTRYSNGNYDKDEMLKNSHVTKFIISYAEFLKAKIAYHKKYPYIENNFSIESLYSKNVYDFSLLVDKKFITDTISLYSLIYQKFVQIPITVRNISTTLDGIIQTLNEELVSLFNLIFYILVAYKNFYSCSERSNPETVLKLYDSQFMEITSKAKEYVEKYRKFRSEIKSNVLLINFPGSGNGGGSSGGISVGSSSNVSNKGTTSDVFIEYLKSLDNHLKFFPCNDFNLKSFFTLSANKDIVGIKLNTSIGNLVRQNLFLENGSKINRSNTVNIGINTGNTNFSNTAYNFNQRDHILNNNSNFKKGFDFSDEKFRDSKTNFDFDMEKKRDMQNNFIAEHTRRSTTPDVTHKVPSNRGSSRNLVQGGNYSNTNPNFNPNTNFQHQNTQSFFNNNFFSKSNGFSGSDNNYGSNMLSNSIAPRKTSLEDAEKIGGSNVINVLNEIFESNKGMNSMNIDVNNSMMNTSQMQSQLNNTRMNSRGNSPSPFTRANNPQMNMNVNVNMNNNNVWNNNPNMVNYDTNQYRKIISEMDNRMYNNNQGGINRGVSNMQNNNMNNAFYKNNNNSPNMEKNINIPNAGVANNTNQNNQNITKPVIMQNTNQFQNYYQGNAQQRLPMGANNLQGSNYTNRNMNPLNQMINANPNANPSNTNYVNNNQNNYAYMNISTNNPKVNQNTNQNMNANLNTNANANCPVQNETNSNIINITPVLEDKINSNDSSPDQSEYNNYESVKSQFPMSIINIMNNFNGVKVYSEMNVETMANEFLKEEFSKKNLQWLISSKDIKYGKQIGFGGSSEVFIADYRGTEVAVKKLRILEVQEENLKEFKREVSSLIMLRHPNLVLFMGAIAEKDNICIVTEYCPGGTLFNILHQKKDLIITWELRIRILYEIAVGMNFLHTNSPPIIHRDLKSLKYI